MVNDGEPVGGGLPSSSGSGGKGQSLQEFVGSGMSRSRLFQTRTTFKPTFVS